MLFLPEYYGIEFSESLPLLTVARMMFIVFYIYTFINRRRNINLKGICLKKLPKEYYFLGGYFIFRIISNLYYVTTYSDAIKTIFEIIFEQLLLLIALYLLAPTKEEIITTIKAVVWSATTLFAIGIFESFTFIRPFDALYTVSRYMLNSYYVRLGLLRSVTTMGLANFYGNMCLLVTPLIFYLHKTTRQKRYLVVLFLDVLAIIHSGCRSDMIFFIIISTIYLIMIFKEKDAFSSALKSGAIVLCTIAMWIAIMCSISERYNYYYVGTGKSLLNTVGFDFDLDEGAPEGVDGYGTNESAATYSRIFQLSGIKYALSINPLFGLGSGAQSRGDIQYVFKDKIYHTNTIDMGIVEILVTEGLIGILGFVSLSALFSYNVLKTHKKSRLPEYNKEVKFKLLFLTTYILCMLGTSNMYPWLTLIVISFMDIQSVQRVGS